MNGPIDLVGWHKYPRRIDELNQTEVTTTAGSNQSLPTYMKETDVTNKYILPPQNCVASGRAQEDLIAVARHLERSYSAAFTCINSIEYKHLQLTRACTPITEPNTWYLSCFSGRICDNLCLHVWICDSS